MPQAAVEATDGFDNRSTGFLALKCGKVILMARLHYLIEGSPEVRFELTRNHPHRFLSLVLVVLIGAVRRDLVQPPEY